MNSAFSTKNNEKTIEIALHNRYNVYRTPHSYDGFLIDKPC